ncbi:argininosuccinate lyase [Gymnodinialimonas ceratoperidinii]|uniref:Argininosuccinate lyase n=1 Tax=Gymnodinialimonas ceratoperidinii TaxID=2856823 RepID=A0A8F6YCU6_9RHOB|nr:argininosuccinate lyase [Gymnodinialimonas ceratoperidinii]QXT39730.1 argininosuccinate lyase [Gymnodinialimonas ceratoperidinii]
MRYLAILSVLAVAACGVDGEPERPDRANVEPGLHISGSAEVGVGG